MPASRLTLTVLGVLTAVTALATAWLTVALTATPLFVARLTLSVSVPALLLLGGRGVSTLALRQIGIVTGATGLDARPVAAAAASLSTLATLTRTAMFGAPPWILVRLVFTGFAAFRARYVRTLADLEFRRRREFDRALEQLLDVPQQRHLVR